MEPEAHQRASAPANTELSRHPPAPRPVIPVAHALRRPTDCRPPIAAPGGTPARLTTASSHSVHTPVADATARTDSKSSTSGQRACPDRYKQASAWRRTGGRKHQSSAAGRSPRRQYGCGGSCTISPPSYRSRLFPGAPIPCGPPLLRQKAAVTEHFIVLVHLDTLRRDDRRARVPDGAAAIAFAGDQHVGGPSKQVVVVDGTAPLQPDQRHRS